ncbi:putative uncharacterized protein DDB_G0277255 [Acyrthosiphon pisum]|uniref:Uncharacterized protein n=1 Tax=Acyrthosiphon pisum TaxID=7029 RepID=A0A8R2AA11_ACYPI|nr:putative uncharacterized protein DDB_G0277255 [Acyrthosiphon pisum]|eukprot:XP_001952399.2 PREDICTED: putative uncharacterized protein DDB_G0277255 [Acyrthosiphon pisum]
METPKKSQPSHRDVDEKYDATTSSPLKALPSPRTPVRATFNDSDDDESDEMESPKFPHLIPIYRRTPDEYDLGGVRIGWDDGYGSVCYQDDDYATERRSKRSKKSRLFSERHHRSFFRSNHYNSSNNESPSPRSCASVNNTAMQEELNNYLECILNCLSAKKRNRQLMKAKMEASSSANSSTENNNVGGCSLDDSADDEMMMLCSQAIEKKIAADANNTNNTVNKPTKLIVSHSLSINGISPLKDTNNATNNNVYYPAAKKFKPVHSKLFGEEEKSNFKSQCHTLTSNMINKSENGGSSSAITTVTNSKKDDSSSSLLDDTLAKEDEFFLDIDFAEIEQQILNGAKETTTASAVQNNYKQPNTNVGIQLEKKTATSNYTSSSSSSSSSVLWRRSTSSSSIVNKQQQSIQQPKQLSSIVGTVNNSSTCSDNAKATTTTTTRYCTPAEIEAKRDRARRTLLLKFKSKNRSVS